MDQVPVSQSPSTRSSVLEPKPKRTFDENVYRAWVWIAVAVCALLTLIGTSSVGDPGSAESQMVIAELTKTDNDSRTQGAPQQQVVNGWFVADTLPIISEQLSGIHQAGAYSSRLYFLVLILTLGVAADVVGRNFGARHNARLNEATEASAETT